MKWSYNQETGEISVRIETIVFATIEVREPTTLGSYYWRVWLGHSAAPYQKGYAPYVTDAKEDAENCIKSIACLIVSAL